MPNVLIKAHFFQKVFSPDRQCKAVCTSNALVAFHHMGFRGVSQCASLYIHQLT